MSGKRKISLVLADVDGTLVTEEKILTGRARNAVNALQRSRYPLRHNLVRRPCCGRGTTSNLIEA